MNKTNKNTSTVVALPSSCDHTGRLGIFDTFKIFMDLANEHAKKLGVDQKTLMKDNLFWLTVKTHIRFYKRPDMDTIMKAETWPVKPTTLRTDRLYRLSTENGLIAEGKTEWAILDLNSNKLYNVHKVFPTDFEFSEDTVDLQDFPRILIDSKKAEIRGPYRVSSYDTDIGNHMNNTAYIRAILSLFSIDELNSMDIQEISIIFKTPAHENDKLSLQIVRNENIIDTALVFEDSKPAALARIICK